MNESSQPEAAASAAPLAEPPERAMLDIRISASANFAAILAEHRLSLLVSTYDAGKVIILRARQNALNAHFVGFNRAMGIAANPRQVAIGTKDRIHELYNMPALLPRLPQSESDPVEYDGCFVPRNTHVTGMIDIHEMAFGGDQLWFINTAFSCLCTMHPAYSFVPQWRPPFIKGLSGDDRCHLNGLAMVGERPAFVTAIAATDDGLQAWRPQRTTGGILMEVPSGEIIARNMSMPHSPRVYANELWVLESGRGTLARVDRRNGRLDHVGAFSGFTRGLDFHGNLAFVGLSQVRQKNIFSGLALTERIGEDERFCGIQVFNLASGRQEGYLKFESGVTEIFALVALPLRFPAMLEEDDPLVESTYALPAEALAQVR